MFLDCDQRARLVDLLLETSGAALSRADFSEALCQVLEDVSGFEHPAPAELARLVADLWNDYRVSREPRPCYAP